MKTLSVEEAIERVVAGAGGAGFVLIGEASHGTHEFWGGPAERKRVRPGLAGSWEASFHELGDALAVAADEPALRERRLQRAIGVIYRPETERQSHYLEAVPAEQFDLLVHLDRTRALEPLERESLWEEGEVPEAYPSAL